MKEWIIRVARPCGVLIMAALLGASAPTAKPVVRIAAFGGFDSFNPFVLRGTAPRGIYRLWMPLMRASAFRPGVLHPAVALRMRVRTEPKQVIFTLNPQARFSDGARITPADVIWTFTTLRAQGQPFFRSYYQGIEAITAEGPGRVVFSLRADAGRALPTEIAGEPILPARFWRHRHFDALLRTAPPGSGPYRIVAFRMGASVTYARVAHWWGRGLARRQDRIARVRYVYFRDRAVARQAFRAGALDAWVLRDRARARLLRSGSVRIVALPIREPAGMHGFVFNLHRPALRSVLVRQGLATMFDFSWINRVLLGGGVRRDASFFANSSLAAPPTTEGNAASGSTGFDDAAMRRAVRLLRQAGYRLDRGVMVNRRGVALRLSVIVQDAALVPPLEAYHEMLARIGVLLRIDVLDPAAYQARLQARNYDLAYAVFPQSRHPGAAEADYFGCKAAAQAGSDNLAGLCDARIDRLVRALRGAPDLAGRLKAAHRLDRALLARWILVPGWYQDQTLVAYRPPLVPPKRAPLQGFDLGTWQTR